MPRSMLAPLAVALSAFLVAPQIQAEPTAPLFVIEQQRSALVTRLAKQWSDAFAVLPRERRLDHEQLSNALFALRADRLFAVTLAGDAEAVEAVLADAKRDAVKPRVSTKSLGDATADLTYTPINPCRILDTRSTVAGPLAPNVARTFDGYSTNFATQGGTGSGCGIPNGVAALAMNVYAVNPTNLGFIKVWPANATEPAVSTVNYQVGITAIATGALVPVDAANSNQFTAKSPATVDFIADVVGYFKPPGDATSLDIKVAGQRVMRYEYNAVSPNVIGGSPANSVTIGVRGATIAGGGVPLGNTDPDFSLEAPNRVTDVYGTVGGGYGNRAGDDLGSTVDRYFATVGGGYQNTASGAASTVGGGYRSAASGAGGTVAGGSLNAAGGAASTVSGGGQNSVSGKAGTIGGGELNIADGEYSTVCGGGSNTAEGQYSTVSGGAGNTAGGTRSSTVSGGTSNIAAAGGATISGGSSNYASHLLSVIGGGFSNTASGEASTIPGGRYNVAAGTGSLAAGQYAHADYEGCYVWSDGSSTNVTSCLTDWEFVARAIGGVRFVTAVDLAGLPTWTCGVSGGAGGSWGCSSDRNLKTELVPLDGVATLERLALLPIYQWVAKDDPRRTPHAGPTAQDFMAAFGLGDNDKMIGFADAQGVAFAAIQGLNAKLAQKDREIAELKRVVEILLDRTSPEGRVAERK